MGCTVYVVLFIIGINPLINATLRETLGPRTELGIYLPISRGFMYELTFKTTTHVQTRWMLNALTDVTMDKNEVHGGQIQMKMGNVR